MKLDDFYNKDFVNYASYDNLRKIASCIDGQKNSSRKVCCCLLDKNIKEFVKVSQLGSKICEYTDYLHGSIDGVVVTLGQDYSGTNNVPLVQKRGNFGTRFSPEASAPRYIFAKGSDALFCWFKSEDESILIKQYFEGTEIEPKFYLPSFPVILINGSEGISSGFAQKILPRDFKLIQEYMQRRLQGEEIDQEFESRAFTPSFNGFRGTVQELEKGQWLISGVFERTKLNQVKITEIPIGYSLKSYLQVLNKLEDDKKIASYVDKSDNDVFEFLVNFPPRTLTKMEDAEVLDLLKLSKVVTENFTCLDENNKIIVFNDAKELFEHYWSIKTLYLGKRKESQISKITQELSVLDSKLKFIKAVQSGALQINNRKKSDIIKDIDLLDVYKASLDSTRYDYLLRMPLYTLSAEKVKEIESSIKSSTKMLKGLKKKSLQELWLADIL